MVPGCLFCLFLVTAMDRSLLSGVLLTALLLSPSDASAQTPDTLQAPLPTESVLESLEDTDAEGEQLAEWLAELLAHPLDINTATAAELSQLPALSPLLAQRIVAFREAFGTFGSIPELRAVEGISEDVFLQIRPFLRIGPVLPIAPTRPSPYLPGPSLSMILADLRAEVIQRVTRQWSAQGDATAGSPTRIYTRLRLRHRRHVSLNLTLEKDPGEAFRWDPQSQTYGYDFASAHLALSDFGRIRSLILGDYYLTAGQGLLFWRSTGAGKSSDTVRPVARATDALRPYGSTEENRFFRGAAVTVRLHPTVEVSLFASRRDLDARLLASEDSTEVFATGLGNTGLHRTPTELAQKDALRETLWGSQIRWAWAGVVLGLQGYQAHYSRPFQPDDVPALLFQLSGSRTAMASAFGQLPLGDLLIFGEVGTTQAGVVGATGGVLVESASAFQGILSWRHFPRDFVSLHGYTFSERSGPPQNETGIYLGMRLKPVKPITIHAYFDQYRFPWVQRRVPRPATGFDALLRLDFRPRPWLSVYAQVRSETKEAGSTTEAGLNLLDSTNPQTRQSLRLHSDYQFSRSLLLRSRAEVVRFAFDEQALGFLLFQDIRWDWTRFLRLDARLAFFDSEAFGARVYMYEYDLRYTFAVPAFNGRGDRAYLLATLLPHPALRLQFKYAVTRQLDESLHQHHRSRALRAQVIWRPSL